MNAASSKPDAATTQRREALAGAKSTGTALASQRSQYALARVVVLDGRQDQAGPDRRRDKRQCGQDEESQAGKAKAQPNTQHAPKPIAVCPHSSRPVSELVFSNEELIALFLTSSAAA